MWRRRRRWLIAAVLAAAVATVSILLSLPPPEPSYHGRKLSAWLDDLGNAADVEKPAKEAIHAMGTNAVPSLIRMLRAKDSKLKLFLLQMIGKQSVVNFHFKLADEVNVEAAYGCEILRADARPAIPALMEVVQTSPTYAGTMAADALVAIGPEGARALAGAVANTNALVRYNIASGFGLVGIRHAEKNATPEQLAILDEEASIAVPALLKILGNKADPARGQAALSLGVLGVQAETVVPALIATVEDANNSNGGPSAARMAASALGKFGPKATNAVPALLIALKHPAPGLRDAAGTALKKIDPEAAAKAGVK